MARAQIHEVVQDQAGNAASNEQVTVKLAGTNTAATVWDAATAGSPLTQPLSTNSNGEIPGYLDAGDYDFFGTGPVTFGPRFVRVSTDPVETVTASGTVQVTNTQVAAGAAIAESKLNLASDAAAATPSRRSLGPGAQQAAPGNDARLSDQRTPPDGSVTTVKIVNDAVDATKLKDDPSVNANRAVTTDHIRDDAITQAKIAPDAVGSSEIATGAVGSDEVAAAFKDGTSGTPSMRTLGPGAQQAAPGDDARLSDARTPLGHVHPASDITSGTIATARLGSGTPDGTKFLRGDQTWAAPAGGTGGSVAGDPIWDSKGDLAVATGPDASAALTVGTNGRVLLADSTQATGLKWEQLVAALVTDFAEAVDDRVGALLTPGGNISMSYNDATNQLQISALLNNEAYQDAVGTILVDTTTIDLIYNDNTPAITADVRPGSLTNTEISGSAAIVLSKLAITGTPNGAKFLRDDGSWATPAIWPSAGVRYVDSTNGSDANDGLSPASPKLTLAAAYAALPSTGGTLVGVGSFDIAGSPLVMSAAKPAQLVGAPGVQAWPFRIFNSGAGVEALVVHDQNTVLGNTGQLHHEGVFFDLGTTAIYGLKAYGCTHIFLERCKALGSTAGTGKSAFPQMLVSSEVGDSTKGDDNSWWRFDCCYTLNAGLHKAGDFTTSTAVVSLNASTGTDVPVPPGSIAKWPSSCVLGDYKGAVADGRVGAGGFIGHMNISYTGKGVGTGPGGTDQLLGVKADATYNTLPIGTMFGTPITNNNQHVYDKNIVFGRAGLLAAIDLWQPTRCATFGNNFEGVAIGVRHARGYLNIFTGDGGESCPQFFRAVTNVNNFGHIYIPAGDVGIAYPSTASILLDDNPAANTLITSTVTKQTYTASNVTTDRTFDANATTIDELADVLGTLIADLRARGAVA